MQMIDLMKRLAELDAKKSNNVEQGLSEGDQGWDDPQYDRQPPERDDDWEYERHRQQEIDDAHDSAMADLYDLIIKHFQKYPNRDELKNFVSDQFRAMHPEVDPKEVSPAFDHLYKKLVNPDYTVPDDVEVGLNYPRDSQRKGEMGMMEGSKIQGLDECGIMPAQSPMGMPRTPASIHITADSGSELSAMLRDIASLAGIKDYHDDSDNAILPGNGSLEIEPLGVDPTDMGPPEPSMRSMIDKLNPSDEKAEETIDSEPDPMSAGKVPANQDPAGAPGAAQGRNQMNNPVATPMPTEDEVYEALKKDYAEFQINEGGRSSWDTSSIGWQNREQDRMDADRRAFKRDELEWELRHEKEQPRRFQQRNKGMYFYNVPTDKESDAFKLGLKLTKSGKWYSPMQNSKADELFGKGRYWEPKQ